MANEHNLIGKGFDAKPENINRKGRPRKTFSKVNAQLAENGFDNLDRAEYTELLTRIMNATESEIKALAKSPSTPYVLRIILTELSDPKRRHHVITDMRDFVFGKPEQRITHRPAAPVARHLNLEELQAFFDKSSDPDYNEVTTRKTH
ncbi:hypothetical protein MVI27_09840 [Chryseobacterium salipaludis]|uniref:hypothetical protein n=1 Tax=Chryseobacterium TaxID=59732 RepID=UPI001FF1B590|nr:MULTISPECIES: hypothetical protein [Chryseobacterium]MCJ8498562.1 hypothetical protein [Chryseobacterium salipaludis]MCX3297113.1 hypothetical protein [Planobacterium sp. JC490]